MIKVEQNSSKYPQCIACHCTDDKKTYRITFGDSSNINTVVELCEDCMMELRGNIYIALD